MYADGRQIANRPAVVQDMSIEIPRGSSVLLIGPNGAGKTTLLKVLGGKHMVDAGAVSVLGHPHFHASHLSSSGSLAYVGGNWERDIAFAGYSIPLAVSLYFFFSLLFPSSRECLSRILGNSITYVGIAGGYTSKTNVE